MRELALAFTTIVMSLTITNADTKPVKVVVEPVPEISVVQIQEVAPVENLRYGFTRDEVYLLAQVLCGDKDKSGDGEYDIDFKKPQDINYNETSKVLCVIMNRVNSPKYPNTVTDVVMARNQFSVMPRNLKATPSDTALKIVNDWCYAYDHYDAGAQVIPTSHLYFSGNGRTNTTR